MAGSRKDHGFGRIPPLMSGVRVLVNPTAGRGAGRRSLDRLRRWAVHTGADVVVSSGPEDLTAQARRAAADGIERLVVAGGDGTQHLAVRGLAGSECALAVVPLGSGNDLASGLGVPRDLDVALDRALEGEIGAIDLGRVDAPGGPVHFAIYCGVGFDSEVTRVANEKVRFVRGPLIYPWAVLRTLAGFVPPTLHVTHDEGEFHRRAMFATAANGPSFGGGMRIAPDAVMDDGLFDLVLVDAVPKLRLLQIFPKVYRGLHLGRPEVHVVRTRSLHLSVDRPMVLYGDGEPLAPIPEDGLRITVEPGALRVVR